MLSAAGLLDVEKQLTTAQISERLAKELNSKADAEALLINSGLITQKELEENATIKVTAAKINEAVANGTLSASDAGVIAGALGITGVNTGATISFDLLTASIWANIKALGTWLVTNPIGWAILGGTAIFGLVKAYDALTDSVEDVKERTDALLETYNSAISEANSNAQTIESLASRYKKLSKGVNNLGENVSLTTDEYSEYNDIVNQIADMFPTMITGYTDEGNAILSLKGNIEELRDAYKEAQKEAYNLLIVSGKDNDENDIITNYQNQVHGNESFLSKTSSYIDGEAGSKDAIEIITRLIGALTPDEFRETYNQLYEEYKNVWNSDKIQYALKSSGFEELTHAPKWSEITLEDLANVRYSAQATIQTYNAEINSQLKNVQTLANAYLMTNSDYEKLDEQSKTAASLLVNSISENIANEFSSKEDVGAYVGKLVAAISDNDEVQNALKDTFTMDSSDMSIGEAKNAVDSYINTIATIIDENPAELKVRLGFDDSNTQPLIDNVKEKLQDGFDNKVGELTLEELQIAAEQIVVDAGTLLSWDELIAKIKEVQSSTLNLENPISFASALTSSEESLDKFQSAVKSAADVYTTLLTGNYSSSELLDSIQALNKAASDMEGSIDWGSILASGNPLRAIQTAIESVSNTYADSVLSGAGIDIDSKFGQMLANIVQEAYKSEAALDSLNTQIDSLQSAYSNLTDIVEVYNDTGYITFDQLQTLLALEPQYLSCLIDENGQLQLNEQAMAALANQRLDDAEAQAIQQAITELGELAYRNEQAAIEDVDVALINNAETLTLYEEKLLETAEIANLTTSEFIQLSNAINGAMNEGASQEQTNTVIDNMNKKLQLIGATRTNLSKSLGSIVGGSSSSSASSTTKSEFSETVDFFERRVEVLDDALSHLDSTLDNVAGSFGKNNLVDAELSINEEKFHNYTDALTMYTQKANEAYFKLPADIAARVKDGAVALTDFIGDGNEDVVEAIKEYQSWADKIQDCQQELAELKKEIRQLELEKFNNIMDDFQNQFDLRGDSKELISKQIDLLTEAGELIGESFFTAQIDQSKKQLELLENEKAQLVNQMSGAINSGRVQKGTEEWLEMVNALSDVDSSILDCKKSIEEFDNSILELHTEIFDRIQEQFSNLDSEISNIIDLFDEFEISDDKGIWSKEGIAQLGLLSQQYELAQYQVQQYNNEIDKLNAQYLAGKYSATEYADRLAELNSEQWNAVNAAESAKDALIDLNETRIENQIKGIEKEIDTYDELTQAQINALKASKDLHDYENSIAEKTKSITDLERQIAAMANDNSQSATAKKKLLQQQLSEAKKDLEEAEYDHSIEAQEDALNKQFEQYEKERNAEIDSLRESLNDRENIIAESFNTVKNNASLVGQEIATIVTEHGVTISKALISSWQSGEKAIAGYGEVLSQNTSAFIGNIMGVENKVWNLQVQANTTADSLAWMFSTKADNLVNELNTSYFAEANLVTMTNALQQSLINTLERGYDISSIVNSLNSVTDAANRARTAVSGLGNVPTTNVSQSTIQHGVTDGINTLYSSNNVDDITKWLNENKNLYSLGNVTTSAFGAKTFKVSRYASGTPKIIKDQIAITNEAGQELIYHAADGSILTPLRQGDKVFDNEAVERLWKLGQGIMPLDMTKNLLTPTVLPNNTNNNSSNVQIGNLVTVQGNVDSSNVKQMEAIANKAVDRLVNRLHDGTTYGR